MAAVDPKSHCLFVLNYTKRITSTQFKSLYIGSRYLSHIFLLSFLVFKLLNDFASRYFETFCQSINGPDLSGLLAQINPEPNIEKQFLVLTLRCFKSRLKTNLFRVLFDCALLTFLFKFYF